HDSPRRSHDSGTSGLRAGAGATHGRRNSRADAHTHCVTCHAAEPTHEAFAKAPAGVLLETIPQVAANAARIMTQVVVNRAMPLGNQTGMTDEERDRIAAWIEGRNK